MGVWVVDAVCGGFGEDGAMYVPRSRSWEGERARV